MKKLSTLFTIGGLSYYLIEVVWRGYSHWSMYIVGGLAFILIGGINEYLSWDTNFFKQCLIATIAVLILEFIAGCILNIWLGLDIWYYDKLHILHQISLPFAFVWYGLSAIAIILDDYLRYWIYKEEKPRYKFF